MIRKWPAGSVAPADATGHELALHMTLYGSVYTHERPAGSPLAAAEFHYCEPPAGEEHARRWWSDPDLPWSVCMFCGVRQSKP